MHRQFAMVVHRVVMNSIQCYSMWLLSQENPEGIYRMAAKTFDAVCWCAQEGNWGSKAEGGDEPPRKEEGGFGGSKPSLKFHLWTFPASGSRHSREVAIRIKLRARSVEALHRGSGILLANELVILNSKVDREVIAVLFNLQVATEHSVHSMAPRMRVTPRHG